MKKNSVFGLFLALTFINFPVNAATLVDFNHISLSNQATYTESGVTFSTPGGLFKTQGTPNGTKGLFGENGPKYEYRAEIAGGASMVSVDLGDFGFDFDKIYLKVYDANNNFLGGLEQICCGKDNKGKDIKEMVTLSLFAQNISYALFGSTGAFPHTVYADNFRYEAMPPAAVPVPAAIWLFFSALLSIVGVKRGSEQT